MSLRMSLAMIAISGSVALAADPAPKPLEPIAPSALTFGTLQAMSPEAAKAKVEAYLKAANKLDQKKLDDIWAKADSTILNRTVESIALGKPEVKTAIDNARDAVAMPPTAPGSTQPTWHTA